MATKKDPVEEMFSKAPERVKKLWGEAKKQRRDQKRAEWKLSRDQRKADDKFQYER